MKKTLIIHTEDFLNALDDHSDSHAWYLDLDNGSIFIVFYDDEFKSDDPEGPTRELVEEHPERFLYIDPLESNESFKIMENFIETLEEAPLREKLWNALSQRTPFRKFKDALLAYPEVREHWFAFQKKALMQKALEWFAYHDIIPILKKTP